MMREKKNILQTYLNSKDIRSKDYAECRDVGIDRTQIFFIQRIVNDRKCKVMNEKQSKTMNDRARDADGDGPGNAHEIRWNDRSNYANWSIQ